MHAYTQMFKCSNAQVRHNMAIDQVGTSLLMMMNIFQNQKSSSCKCSTVQCPLLHRCSPDITTSALCLTLDSDNYQDTKTLLIFPVCALSYFVNTSRGGTSNVYFYRWDVLVEILEAQKLRISRLGIQLEKVSGVRLKKGMNLNYVMPL